MWLHTKKKNKNKAEGKANRLCLQWLYPMESNPLTKKCTKPWCQWTFPATSNYKKCDHCQNHDKENQKAKQEQMLNMLEHEGAGFLRLARACMEKEKKFQLMRGGETPTTWEKSTITTTFYHPRPTNVEMNTWSAKRVFWPVKTPRHAKLQKHYKNCSLLTELW